MFKGKCRRCHKKKPLTRHSKAGNHRPPWEYVCRDCHDEIHGIKRKPKSNRKYQPGTKKRQKK